MGQPLVSKRKNTMERKMPCVESHSSYIAGQPMMGAPKSKSDSDGSTTPVAEER